MFNFINRLFVFKFDFSTGRSDKGKWFIDIQLTNDLESLLSESDPINAIGFRLEPNDVISLEKENKSNGHQRKNS